MAVPPSQNEFLLFFSSPEFLSALGSWFLAQFIKTIISLYKRSIKSGAALLSSLIWKTGGMPSSHSAMVSALAVSIGLSDGLDTTGFALAIFYGLVVIRDALGVRRAAGNQARAHNKLGERLKERFDIDFEPVKEIHGHKPLEVLIGVILGVCMALAVHLL